MPAHKEPDFTALPGSYFIVTNILNIGLFYLNVYFLYPQYMNSRKWWIYLFSLLIAAGSLFFIKILYIQEGFPAIRVDGVTRRFAFFSTLVFVLISFIYRVLLNNARRERQLKEIQATQLMTELKFLRSQVSPHFLFNVLTNLVSLARTRSDQLEPSLIMLADLMRYMLYNSGEKKVTLTEEVQYLKSYIQLQQLRFGNDVTIAADFEIDPGQDHWTIEPMLLIPFVENAFKHGVGWIEQPAISICLKLTGSTLDLAVQNRFNENENEAGKDPASGIGLVNVQARLKLLYPGKHTLSLAKENDLYFVHLTIDLT